MKTRRSFAVWWRWLQRVPARPRRKPDFGDHGTAFALDLCLAQAYAPTCTKPDALPAPPAHG